MHFFMYIYSIIFISTLHVSNDRIVHHQKFSLFTVFTALYKVVVYRARLCTDLELTQPLTEMSTKNISWGVKAAGA
jgi:hypothetical protein